MAESYNIPGLYTTETDQSQPAKVQPSGVPAVIIGTSLKGPAFVPVTVPNFDEYAAQFGTLDPKRYGPYAMNEFLKNRSSATFVRVLGAGSNNTTTEIAATEATGRVVNAGFKIIGGIAELSADPSTDPIDFRHSGSVQFIAAKHIVRSYEAFGLPMFTSNNSFAITGAGQAAYLIRAMVLMADDSRLMILNGNEIPDGTTFLPAVAASLPSPDDLATLSNGYFKLVISSSAGSNFGNSDGLAGIRILTASLDPSDSNYFGKVLNTDPTKFESEKHYLHLDFAVDAEIASGSSDAGSIAILSGSERSLAIGDTSKNYRDAFGLFDTRFKTPKTSWFISQPFGATEHNLFYVEALDDGDYANDKFKISIANLKMSSDPTNDYGTFTLIVRDFADTDLNQRVYESYPNLTLDPASPDYIAKKVGDIKYSFNFDAENEDERRVNQSGRNPNQSRLIRVVMNPAVEDRLIPATCLPFGFRGIETLKTNAKTNVLGVIADAIPTSGQERLRGIGTGMDMRLPGSIIPPMPFRYKVTRGTVETSPPAGSAYAGYPGINELVDPRMYWGVKFERNNQPLNPNTVQELNPFVAQISKFSGLKQLGLLVTGSEADGFCDNKFTLAKVALSNQTIADVSSSADTHMREAAYMRDITPRVSDYTLNDVGPTSPINRVGIATLHAMGGYNVFNKFSDYLKFSTLMYGGYDGVNILDKETLYLTDKAASSETEGGASVAFTSPGLPTNMAGTGSYNSTVNAYKVAAKIATDRLFTSTNKTAPIPNIVAVPGIRDHYVTDYVMSKVKEYGFALYVMDIASLDDDENIIFDGALRAYPNVDKTAESLEGRSIDNDSVAVYYPDITIQDNINGRLVKVPASIAALSAIGFNDRVGYPWYVPAGTNRASLDFVKSVSVRLDTKDQGRLQNAKINPIVKMPTDGTSTFYAIMGQKNLKQSKSRLDRVSVRRMLFDLKRVVSDISNRLIFNQDIPTQRKVFVSLVSPILSSIQTREGIEKFDVICDERNNTVSDVQSRKMNARIVLVPTGTTEIIILDFTITNSGVNF
jgi:hypothetical protein